MKITVLFLLVIAFALSFAACAVNRVLYNEETQMDGVLARVVVLDSSNLMELVITMQETGGPKRERVFSVNWMPDYFELGDYNEDERLDFKIVSTSGEPHYFYSTAQGFIDI
jgi:hypothetical protein